MGLPDKFQEVILTDHVKHEKPVGNKRIREVVKHLGGPIYKDKKRDSYHLLDGSVSIVFTQESGKAVVITAYPNFQRRKYPRSSRFSRIH